MSQLNNNQCVEALTTLNLVQKIIEQELSTHEAVVLTSSQGLAEDASEALRLMRESILERQAHINQDHTETKEEVCEVELNRMLGFHGYTRENYNNASSEFQTILWSEYWDYCARGE